ncbi:hypothetical protein Fot_48282 [Forsythia ovata]|uniref:Uncharacterized protein n=1 Tax=Forsythia ovata TaxID=205694 RepID=A0ABD1QSS7_9LAMI
MEEVTSHMEPAFLSRRHNSGRRLSISPEKAHIGVPLPRLDFGNDCYGSRHRYVKGSGTAAAGKRKQFHCFGHFRCALMEKVTAHMELSFLSRWHNSGRRLSLSPAKMAVSFCKKKVRNLVEPDRSYGFARSLNFGET